MLSPNAETVRGLFEPKSTLGCDRRSQAGPGGVARVPAPEDGDGESESEHPGTRQSRCGRGGVSFAKTPSGNAGLRVRLGGLLRALTRRGGRGATAYPPRGGLATQRRLSDGKHWGVGAPGGNRTPDPRLRRPLLYPTELQARASLYPSMALSADLPGEAWAAHRIAGLSCAGRTTEMGEMVGASRFERPTSCSQGRRATRLRHAPTRLSYTTSPSGWPAACKTPAADKPRPPRAVADFSLRAVLHDQGEEYGVGCRGRSRS